jgi:hypothetical protein
VINYFDLRVAEHWLVSKSFINKDDTDVPQAITFTVAIKMGLYLCVDKSGSESLLNQR